jgi:uncharacterized protein (TIGR02246 family)
MGRPKLHPDIPQQTEDSLMRTCAVLFLALAVGLCARPASAAQPPGTDEDKAALAKRADAFVAAFHQGDAKAVAAFWTPDGDYTDQTGHHWKGREAIEKTFQGLFAENKGLKLRIDSDALRFLTPEVAIEDGTTAVIPPDGAPPSRARYTIVHVKKDGQWYLGSVRDAAFAPPSNYDQLRGLEWAIGDWADEAATGEVARASYSWGPNQNFILSSYTTTFKNIAIGGGTQWIGWDPLAKSLRSWTFGTDGSFGEGAWSREGNDKWIITTSAILRDGKKVVATVIVVRIDADTMTWRAKDRAVDGNVMPDTKEIKMKRVK